MEILNIMETKLSSSLKELQFQGISKKETFCHSGLDLESILHNSCNYGLRLSPE